MAQATIEQVQRWSSAALWYSWFVSPLAFGADLILGYALVQHACSTGHFYVLHLLTIFALLFTLSGGLLAWREYNRIPREVDDEGGSPSNRARFMAIFGMVWCGLFVIIILANGVPRMLISPCD